ncbi:MAG: DUF4215 domain-containing protein [bacterium]
MKKFIRSAAILCALALWSTLSLATDTGDIEFKFEIPPLPYPPVIGDIQNTDAMEGEPHFTVSIQIEASIQKEGNCYVGEVKIEDPSSNPGCDELTAWKQEAHEDIHPNPPDIKKVMLYYYRNGETDTTASIPMTYNPVTKLATANVPIDPSLKYKIDGVLTGHNITFYVVALDHYGNVASQVPDTAQAPCVPGTTSWTSLFSTPAWDTCSLVTQYEECAKVCPDDDVDPNTCKNAAIPPTCGSDYTTNDRIGDTCGEPNANGDQFVLNPPVNKTDILGVQAGADSSYFCIRMGLGTNPPPTSDSPPIEGYLAVFFNPDIPDSNPGDTHIENAFAITYAPEAQGSDPTLVRVLWDVECISNPNTADPLGCKIKSAIPGDTDLSMGYNAGGQALVFVTKKSWGAKQLIGSSSKLAQIITLTGEINLSGDNLFWLVDMTNGLGFYHKNTTVLIKELTEPTPTAPQNPVGECNLHDASGSGKTACPKNPPKPTAGNDCIINFLPSLQRTFVERYKIYSAMSDSEITDANKATYYIGEVTEDQVASTFSFIDTIAEADLDGFTRFYKLTSVNDEADVPETLIANASKTTCAPEDWEAPNPATGVTGETPEGTTEKCGISWTMETDIDTSITGYFILRDGTALYDVALGSSPSKQDYSYTDPATLVIGNTYTYAVRVVDRGENYSTDATVDCQAEDRKPPAKIDSLSVTLKGATLGAKMDWEDSAEDDIAGYYAHVCRCWESNGYCDAEEDFAKMNGKLLDSQYEDTNPIHFPAEDKYCLYAEAMDDCDTAGTCPISGGPNLSGFPGDSMSCAGSSYMKCLYVTTKIDYCYPSFPVTNVPTPEDEGGKCTFTWEKVSTNSNPVGAPEDQNYCPATFPDPVSPAPEDIIGYLIVKIEDPTGECANMPYPNDPLADVIGFVPINSTHEWTAINLTNDRTYCFLPFSVDVSGNHPAPSTLPNGKPCTPADIVAPDEPEMVGMDADDTPSCTPQWSSVSDPDPIIFNLYRCDDAKASCTEGDFAALETDLTTLETTDGTVEDGMAYTYAITAEDPSGNESAIVGASNIMECALGICGNGTVETGEQCDDGNTTACDGCSATCQTECGNGVTECSEQCDDGNTTPDDGCSPTCQTEGLLPPASANTTAIAANSGCKFWFTASPSDTDTGTFETNEGYKIYLCTGTTAGTCEDTPISTRSACADAAAAGGIIRDICNHSLDKPYNQQGLLSAGKDGTWYAGITYTDSTDTESDKRMSSSSCLVTGCTSDLVDITTGAMQEIDYEATGEFIPTVKPDLTIEVVDQDNPDTPIAAGATGEDGMATIEVCPADLAGKTIRVQIRIAAANATGMLCDDPGTDNPEGDCLLYLKEDIAGADMGTGYPVAKTVALPKAGALAGRKEIGNANCDGIVDFNDFMEIKDAYKKKKVDNDGYRAWADFDNNGVVDFNDFMKLKDNYKKKVFGTVDDADPAFCMP